MKFLILASFLSLVGCSGLQRQTQAPDWVDGVRSGNEKLKVSNGSKVMYRRIAGSKGMDRDQSCEAAITKAEEDLKKEHPLFDKIPYAMEVLFYDERYEDCAVTISISSSLSSRYEELKKIQESFKTREQELESKISTAQREREELEVKHRQLQSFLQKNSHLLVQVNNMESTAAKIAALLRERAEIAKSYAYTGLHLYEFEKSIKSRAFVGFRSDGLCRKNFEAYNASIHGSTWVCWEGNHIVGYCSTTQNQCWTRNP